MVKSLQQIEDYYLSRGFKGEELRKALERDSEFQQLLKEKKAEIRDKFGVTEEEEKEFLLPNEEDYKVLSIVKNLESKDLSDNDTEIVKMIKTQLQADWREPLLSKLKQLLQKYP